MVEIVKYSLPAPEIGVQAQIKTMISNADL